MISEQELIGQYRQHVRPLYRFLSRRTGGDASLTEDLVQETWLRALRDWRCNGLPRKPMAWLTRVGSNLLASYYRALKPSVDFDPDLLAADEASGVRSPEVAQVLHLALQKLRPGQARLIEAFHFDGKGVAEIAAELGISERAAEGRMRRARAALRDRVGALQQSSASAATV